MEILSEKYIKATEEFSPHERPDALRRLVDMIDAAGGHMDCGVLGLRVIFRVLASSGMADLAYDMITRTDPPSYGFIVDGLSACSMIEFLQKETTGDTTSFNHHFMGDVSGFFISHIAGLCVNPQLDDPCNVLVRPSFVKKLTRASAYYRTPKGEISVSWERAGGNTILFRTERESGVKASIVLPAGHVFEDTGLTSKSLPKAGGTDLSVITVFRKKGVSLPGTSVF